MRRLDFKKALFLVGLSLSFAGCGESKGDPKAEAPPPAVVEHAEQANIFEVEHPEQFPLTAAVEHLSTSQLTVTGTVNPDISRNVPVISIAPGRLVVVKTPLCD